MTRAIHRSAIAVLIALSCLPSVPLASTAHASNCSIRQDSLQAAPVVFSGKVLNITHNQGDDVVLIDVYKKWRGGVQSQAVVHTGETARDCGVGNCGYKFKVGNSYLVFAYEWPAQPGFDMQGSLTIPPGVPTLLMTDICSRTSLLSAAQQDLESLGADGLPFTGSDSVDDKSVPWPYFVVAVALFVGVGLRWLAVRKKVRNL